MHATRATAAGNSFKAKEPVPEMAVTDPLSAMEYLISGDFKSEDEELTLDFLSIIAMQMSHRPKLSTFQASDSFKALAYLILDLHEKRTMEAITDVIAKAVSLAMKRAVLFRAQPDPIGIHSDPLRFQADLSGF